MHRPPSLRRLTIIMLGVIVGALVPLGPVAAQSPAAEVAQPAPADTGAHTALAIEDTPPAAPEIIDFDILLGEVESALETMPAEEWVLADVAASLGGDTDAAFTFVRDHIAFDPYPGVLRSPQGTLAARAGNSWDRALLLQALLGPDAVTRLALGSLDADTDLDERALAGAPEPLPLPVVTDVMPFDIEAMAARARRDNALLREALGSRVDSIGATSEAATDTIAANHAWLQVSDASGGWLDLDATPLDATPGTAIAVVDNTFETVPDEAQQLLTVRLIADIETTNGPATNVLLDESIAAADAADRDMWLLFSPENTAPGGVLAGALGEETGWVPALFMHGDARTGETFTFGADTDEGGGTVLGDALGGLGGGGDVATDELGLVELRMELETTGPGLEPQSVSRILYDDTAGEALPAILNDAHHILVSNGGFDLRRMAVARGAVTVMAAEIINEPEIAPEYRLVDKLLPWAVADRTLAAVSEHVITPGLTGSDEVRAFVGRPRAWIVSHGLNVDDETFGGTIDLALDGVSLVGPPDVDSTELAEHRLWYGVLQTALETETARRRVRNTGDTPTLSSVSIDSRDGLTVLDDPGGAPDSSALAEALAAGSLVVGADYPATGSFWTIDPATGATTSVQEPGIRPSGYGGSYPGAGGSAYRLGDRYPTNRFRGPSRNAGGGLEYQIVSGVGYVAAVAGAFGAGWLIGRAFVNVVDWMYSD